jgi:hypothetical protein
MERRGFLLATTALGGVAAAASPVLSANPAPPPALSRAALESLLAACDELQKQYLDVPWRIQSPDDIAEGERGIRLYQAEDGKISCIQIIEFGQGKLPGERGALCFGHQ